MATCGFLASRQRLECADSSRRFSQRCELQWRKRYRREHMRRFDSGAWERRTPYASRGIDAWAWVGPIVDGNLWVFGLAPAFGVRRQQSALFPKVRTAMAEEISP